MWQVAELPLNFPDASQDSQAENQVLLSSLRLLWRSVLWPLAGCKCRDTSAGRLEASWSDCAPVKTVTALSVVAVLNLCLCHPITEMTCRTCEVHGGTRCVLIYSGSSATWTFILLRIRRKSAFPAILWRALLTHSPFLGLFLLVQSLCGCLLSPSPCWHLRWWTQSFCSKPWCLLALSECSSLHSWKALMGWVKVRCLGHGSGMKQELSSRREGEREKHGWRIRNLCEGGRWTLSMAAAFMSLSK